MFPCANWLSPRCDDRSVEIETDCSINAGVLEIQLTPNQPLSQVNLTNDIWPSETCQKLNCGRAKVGLRLLAKLVHFPWMYTKKQQQRRAIWTCINLGNPNVK